MFVLYVCTGVLAGPELRLKTQTPPVQQVESVFPQTVFVYKDTGMSAGPCDMHGGGGRWSSGFTDIKPPERKCTPGRRRWGRTQSPAPGQASIGSWHLDSPPPPAKHPVTRMAPPGWVQAENLDYWTLGWGSPPRGATRVVGSLLFGCH